MSNPPIQTNKTTDNTTALTQHLTTLPKQNIHQHTMHKYLKKTNPTQTIKILKHIHQHNNHNKPPYNISLLALTNLLNTKQLQYKHITKLYQTTKKQQQHNLLNLFFSPQAPTKNSPHTINHTLTLKHHKTQAHTNTHNNISPLLHHPKTEVIPHLLQNPHLTKLNIIKLTTKHPTTPKIQHLLTNSPH